MAARSGDSRLGGVLIRHKVPFTMSMTVTRHRSLDTLLAYAHEVDRDKDPAERYVDYGEGAK